MTRRGSRVRGVWLSLGLALMACGTATFVVQQYDGPPLSEERIAILRLKGGSNVVIVSLDGEELSYAQQDPNTRLHLELLPGEHELEVGNADDPLSRVVAVALQAEAGKVYRLSIDALGPGTMARPWKVLVWEVDRHDDRALRTVAPPPDGAPAGTSARPLAAPTGVAPSPVTSEVPRESSPEAAPSGPLPTSSSTGVVLPEAAPSSAPLVP